MTHRKTLSVAGAVALLAISGVAVSYAPTLYRLFCGATGYGGTVKRGTVPAVQADASAARTVTVLFDANVAPGLDWSFAPGQRQVTVRVGEPTKAYYVAKNLSDHTIVARAAYNVTPYKIAPYFFKVQCFCFTNERLAPGESAEMPLVFYIDEQALKDRGVDDVRQVTLSYTFFEQQGLSPAEIGTARDLSAGSKAEQAKIAADPVAAFENDARRK
jgi:cytochrome c oxidase assembly protein subunit 11